MDDAHWHNRWVTDYEEFGDPVFRVVGPKPVRRGGGVAGGGSGTWFSMNFFVGPRDALVHVQTAVEEHRRPDALVASLLSQQARRRTLRYPLNLTVTREQVPLEVDRTRVPFTLYACGRDAVAAGVANGRWIYVEGPRSVLRRLELAAEPRRSVLAFMARLDKEVAEARADLLRADP